MITFFRGLTSCLICIIILIFQNKCCYRDNFIDKYFGNKKKLLLVRGILGGLTTSCSFFAVKYLNLSIATVIISTAPIITGIMSYCLQNCSRKEWTFRDTISALISFSGLVVISIKKVSEKNTNFFLGFIAALSSAVFSALVNITIHDIKDENTVVITLYSMSFCSLITLPGLIVEFYHKNAIHNKPLSMWWNIQLFSTGLISFSAQSLKTLSIQISNDLGVIVFKYLDIVFCLLWDVFILQTRIDIFDYVGVFCILLGCCMFSCT
jgi:drug/metabolite transporter (DMT)-like permease